MGLILWSRTDYDRDRPGVAHPLQKPQRVGHPRKKSKAKSSRRARSGQLPMVERLVKHPKEWPWSSFSFYAKDEPGLIGWPPLGKDEDKIILAR